MVEFGEKIKKLREERGMTQQSMADMLYVTRQAVSRWECGARFPDLLTAKKIAYILGVTVDDLLSGEEIKKNIEDEPILEAKWEKKLQAVLYTMAVCAYALIAVLGIYSLFPGETLAKTPAGRIDWWDYLVVGGYLLNLLLLIVGLVMTLKEKPDTKITGVIMGVPYFTLCINYKTWWIAGIGVLLMGIIIAYFWLEKKNFLWWVVEGVCLAALVELCYSFIHLFGRYTDLGVCVHTVHSLGRLGLIVLLGYQAYMWNYKKLTGIKA